MAFFVLMIMNLFPPHHFYILMVKKAYALMPLKRKGVTWKIGSELSTWNQSMRKFSCLNIFSSVEFNLCNGHKCKAFIDLEGALSPSALPSPLPLWRCLPRVTSQFSSQVSRIIIFPVSAYLRYLILGVILITTQQTGNWFSRDLIGRLALTFTLSSSIQEDSILWMGTVRFQTIKYSHHFINL